MEFHSPAVSVIIPIYNVEKYLVECLDSAVNQTLKNIEIICVDDGSPDRSAEIAAEYVEKYDNVKLIRKENGGQSSARNAALEVACGQYIYFLDSDDYLERNALEELYTRAVKDNLDLLFFNAIPFFESRLDKQANASYIDFYRREGSYAGAHTGQTMFAMMQKNGEFLGSPCFEIIRRSLIEENGLRFYNGIIHEDNLFVFQCTMLASRAGYTDKAYYHRRLHGGTTMTAQKSMRNVEGYLVSHAEMLHFLHDRQMEAAVAPLISDYLRSSILESARTIYQSLDIPAEEVVLSKGGFCASYFLDTIKSTSDTALDSVSLKVENDALRKALQTIEQQYESSFTFRVGRIVTWIPRMAVRTIALLRDNGLRFTLRKIAEAITDNAKAADERMQEQAAYRLLTYLPRQVRHNVRWVRSRGIAYAWRCIRMKIHMPSCGTMPLVSIVLPVYNVEPYLEQCLDSLRKQTLKSIEIIAVDDGSTDRSLEILNRYAAADKRIHVYTQKNQYAGAARNVGLSHATGEYLLFLDSDDFFSKNLAKDAYITGKAANADIILFDADKYDTVKDSFDGGCGYLCSHLAPRCQPFQWEDCPDDIFRITTPSPWTKMFRRQFVLDSGLKFQNIQNSNDLCFVLSSLPLAKRIVTVNKKLVHYRVGISSNLQSTKSKNPLCFYEAYHAWHDKLAEVGVLDALRQSYVNTALFGCVFNLCTMNDLSAKGIVFNKLKEGVHELELAGHEEAFYCVKEHYKAMCVILNGTFEEYLRVEESGG